MFDFPWKTFIAIILLWKFGNSKRGKEILDSLHAFANEYNEVYSMSDDEEENKKED